MKIISELYAIGVFFQGILSISSLKAWQSLGPPIRTSAIRTRLVMSLYHLSTTPIHANSDISNITIKFGPALLAFKVDHRHRIASFLRVHTQFLTNLILAVNYWLRNTEISFCPGYFRSK